ncbi:hypothetical protein SAMD00019534_045630 [Acytostelium subglobosum LB1]|uniref:hypothetical protein n=1 Tax=Acytostelium subglobosum LB1 TaxID=1410327 RepID=UPI000644887C|nr:hypothetical protein SAMD00019534_045630 [Acytostelium subglobosum LB1]GAM21388.1 hypothetical protein SAMD00019534_045630 [Acytostelium subglobosum LB1]|eukprot:XP_012755507.1 hypothetical protein SAMD00019534_045630 [Acytostelium subglobosum LB1]
MLATIYRFKFIKVLTYNTEQQVQQQQQQYIQYDTQQQQQQQHQLYQTQQQTDGSYYGADNVTTYDSSLYYQQHPQQQQQQVTDISQGGYVDQSQYGVVDYNDRLPDTAALVSSTNGNNNININASTNITPNKMVDIDEIINANDRTYLRTRSHFNLEYLDFDQLDEYLESKLPLESEDPNNGLNAENGTGNLDVYQKFLLDLQSGVTPTADNEEDDDIDYVPEEDEDDDYDTDVDEDDDHADHIESSRSILSNEMESLVSDFIENNYSDPNAQGIEYSKVFQEMVMMAGKSTTTTLTTSQCNTSGQCQWQRGIKRCPNNWC